MPKISKDTAPERMKVRGRSDTAEGELDGYTVNLQGYDVDMDFSWAFKGLPDDACTASHLGYVIKGKVTARMVDGTEEVFAGGDALILKPGHTFAVTAGTEFVTFTPTDEANATKPVVERNVMAFAAEHGIDLSG